MNDKTAQSMADALIDQIESAARASFRRHQSSIKGQILTAADNYDWHLLHAAYQAGIHAMRRQLADAQRDAVVGTKVDMTNDFLHTLIEKADYHGGQFDIQAGNEKWIVTVTKETS